MTLEPIHGADDPQAYPVGVMSALTREQVMQWAFWQAHIMDEGSGDGLYLADIDQLHQLALIAFDAGRVAERDACIEDVRTVGWQFSVECEALIRARGKP